MAKGAQETGSTKANKKTQFNSLKASGQGSQSLFAEKCYGKQKFTNYVNPILFCSAWLISKIRTQLVGADVHM